MSAVPRFVPALEALETRSFDCVIVGGGIHGASLLLAATLRGRRALLVEQNDLGRGASARSLRILHGGLRYLQSGDLLRFRESVRARRWFLATFPEFTAPRAFLLPLDGRGPRRGFVFRAAFALDAFLSRDRNRTVLASHRLPRGRVIASPASIAAPPSLGRSCALWFDGWISEPQRLMIELLRWSASRGASVLPRTRAVRLLVENGGITGLVLAGRTGETTVSTKNVILAAGAWTAPTLDDWGLRSIPLPPIATAYNVVLAGELPPLPEGVLASTRWDPSVRPAYGLGVPARDGKNAFLWSDRGLTFVGTMHASESVTPEGARVSAERVAGFLAGVGGALPELALPARRIVGLTVGRLPARAADDPEMPHRDAILGPREHGGPDGLQVVLGLKYTTAPEVAGRVAGGEPRADSRPGSRGTIRADGLLAQWAREPEAVLSLARTLMVEEAAPHLSDLLLGRMDGTEDAEVVRALARVLAPHLFPGAESEQMELLERDLEPQLPPSR